MNNLENKVIIITGGSKGIGRVTALRLAKQNARLVLASRKIADLMKIKDELQLPDDRILLVQADVSNEEDCSSIVNQAVEKFGRVDVLINNAAQFNRSKVIDLDLNDFDRVWKTNVRGVIAMTQRVLPHMINQN